MNKYGICFNDCTEMILMDAEFFSIENGFVKLYRLNADGCMDVFAAYNSSTVHHCVLQKQFTQDELIEHIGAKNE